MPISKTMKQGRRLLILRITIGPKPPACIERRHVMQGWTQYFANQPDFGMYYLMQVPDQCIYFLLLMWCLLIIMSIREKEPSTEESEDD
ncbi:MAG: hypothetical protein AB9866_23735 [Syntrophobacteraceae bacterium]